MSKRVLDILLKKNKYAVYHRKIVKIINKLKKKLKKTQILLLIL